MAKKKAEFASKNVNLYRYEISTVAIDIPGEGTVELKTTSEGSTNKANKRVQYSKSNQVKEIEIIEDFEKNVFPIFKLVAIVDPSTYKKIMRNKNSISVTLRINKYYSKIDSTDKKGPGSFIETKLQLIMNENVEDLMYTQRLQANLNNMKKSTSNDDMNDLQMVDNAIELYLFKSASLDGTKSSNCNVIMKNATVTDAIAYIAASAQTEEGSIKNLLMSKPDNTSKYDVLLIPPLSILKAFLYIDIYYGLYKTGSLIYFGIDRNYILKYTGAEVTAWGPEEEKIATLTIPKTDNTFSSATLGQVGTGESASYIGDFHTLDISNDSIANNYIAGNGSQFVDSYTGDVNSSTGSAFNKNTSYLRLLENRTENEYLNSMYTKQSEANSIVVTVNLQDVDISRFTPNKLYKLSFQDSSIADRYDGNFTLSYAKHSFIVTGTALTVNSQLILKKLS